MARAVRRAPRRRTGASATTTRRCGTRVLDIPGRGALGGAQRAAQLPVRVHPRARAAALDATSTSARARVVAAGTLLDPERADDRLRAPLHRLQAARADLPRPRAAARASSTPRGGPVQIVFAGKAHPADDTGKHHLQQVYRRALDPMFGGRIAFVDDYDLHVAHFLVQGCDVWLNNPRKPLEASGTSGMKAAINGVPHLSIGDGWWAEGYNGTNGWLIDGARRRDDSDAVDAADAEALYQLLEERDRAGVLRARRRRHPAPLARDRQGGDPHGRAALQRAPHGQGVRRRACTRRRSARHTQAEPRSTRLHACSTLTQSAECVQSTDVPQDRRPDPVRAVRREGGLRAARRGDATAATAGTRRSRSKRSSRASSRSSATSARTAPRNTSIYHSTLKRPCGQLIVVDDGYDLFLTMMLYPNFALGRGRLPPRGRSRRAHRSPRSSWTSSPPRSSSPGAAASGTWKSSARPTPSRRTGTARCRGL